MICHYTYPNAPLVLARLKDEIPETKGDMDRSGRALKLIEGSLTDFSTFLNNLMP